jgi:hypothetical protein
VRKLQSIDTNKDGESENRIMLEIRQFFVNGFTNFSAHCHASLSAKFNLTLDSF